jgi:hypothetical protein
MFTSVLVLGTARSFEDPKKRYCRKENKKKKDPEENKETPFPN